MPMEASNQSARMSAYATPAGGRWLSCPTREDHAASIRSNRDAVQRSQVGTSRLEPTGRFQSGDLGTGREARVSPVRASARPPRAGGAAVYPDHPRYRRTRKRPSAARCAADSDHPHSERRTPTANEPSGTLPHSGSSCAVTCAPFAQSIRTASQGRRSSPILDSGQERPRPSARA